MPFEQIPLSGGRYAIVDAEDFERINARHWHCSDGYAVRWVGTGEQRKKFYMHHEVLGLAKRADHINGDTLDNRRENLRHCTQAENCRNRRKQTPASSSHFKGVSFHANTGKWQARVTLNGQQHYLGLFGTEVQAANAYDAKCSELHGAFARPNAPTGDKWEKVATAMDLEKAQAAKKREGKR